MANIIAKHGLEVALGLSEKSKSKFYNDLTSLLKDAGKKTEQEFAQGLINAINSAFTAAGKTSPFNMSEILNVEGLGQQIANEMINGMKNAVSNIGLSVSEQIKQLEAEQSKLLQQQKAIQKRSSRFSIYENLLDLPNRAEYGEISPFSKSDIKARGGHAEIIANDILDNFINLQEVVTETTKGTDEYYRALIRAAEAARELYKMQGYMESHQSEFKDKNLISLFNYDNLKATTSDLFAELSANNNLSTITKLQEVDALELQEISTRLSEIEVKTTELNSTDIINQQDLQSGIKQLNEIEAAYKRILNEHHKVGKQGKWMSSVLSENFVPKDGIKTLYNQYIDLPKDSPWETQYTSLLKFIKTYEAFRKDGKRHNDMNVPEIQSLYEQFKPMAENIENALRNVLNMATGKPLIGIDVAEQEIPVTVNPEIKDPIDTPEEVTGGKVKIPVTVEPVLGDDWRSSLTDLSRFKTSNEDVVKTTEAEASARAKSTAELEKQEKLLLYRIGKTTFNPDKFRNLDMMGNSVGALQLDQASFGDGLFATTKKAATSIIDGDLNADNLERYFEFDASKYDLFINKTVEQAEKLQSFLQRLQKFVLAAGDFRGFDDELVNVNETSLFNEASQIFERFNMTQKQFTEWVAKMKELVIANGLNSDGKFVNADESFINSRNFGTRFMQTMGYQGVLNDTGDIDIDGLYKGSVIYEPDFAQITEYIENTKASFTTIKDFLMHLGYSAESAENFAKRLKKQSQSLEQLGTPITEGSQHIDSTNEQQSQTDRRSELVSQLDSYGADKDTTDELWDNLATRRKIYAQLQEEGLLTDEIKAKYNEINDIIQKKIVSSLSIANEQVKNLNQNGVIANADTSTPSKDSIALQEQISTLQSDLSIANEQIKIAQDGQIQAEHDLERERQRSLSLEEYNQSLERSLQHSVSTSDFEDTYNQMIRLEAEIERLRLSGRSDKYDRSLDSVDKTQTDIITTSETTELIKLKEIVEAITTSVNTKTKAFYNEGQVVSQVVDKEIKALMHLDSSVKSVNEKVAELLTNISTVVNISNQSKGININIDTSSSADSTTSSDDAQNPQRNLTELQSLYQELGELRARYETAGSIAIKDRLQQIADEIKLKKESLGITQAEAQELRKISEASYNKQKTNLKAEEERRDQEKQAEKFRTLGGKYEKLGRLQAEVETTSDPVKAEELRILQEEIIEETKKLNLYDQQNKKKLDELRTKQELAKQDRLSLLNAKNQRKIWNDSKKSAQRTVGVNAADAVIRSGKNTVLNTIGNTDISASVDSMAYDLSAKIQRLEQLKNEISAKGADFSLEDQKHLSKTTAEVKEQILALQNLLKIHTKYSSGDVKEFDWNGSTPDKVGWAEYERQMTSAVQAQAEGRVTVKGLNRDTGELSGTIKTGANTFVNFSAVVGGLDGKFKVLRKETVKTEALFDAVKRKVRETFSYFSGSMVIYRAFYVLRDGIQSVKDIDNALVELRKVTDATEDSYDRFLQTASKTGSIIGSTIADFTRATATFAKLGYDMNIASEMAEAAVVYQNVGDGIESADAAAESIISTMKGFGLETSESMEIVDRFNEVGNKFSITSKGIGDALQRSASALNEGGNSIDESIGLITAANSVVQDPDSVGTALKTLTLRLRGAKTELEEAGLDAEDMVETTSTLQSKLLGLTNGKVDIMLNPTTFKNSTEILREMAAAWEDMNDIQRASALELMGGKRQANILSAIIQNFDLVEDVIETSANASGSALRENEVALDSIEGKIKIFTNSLQTMWKNVLDSDVIKGFVSFGTILIKIIDKIGIIPTLLAGLAVGGMILGKTGPIGLLTNLFEAMAMGSAKIKEFGFYLKSLTSSSHPLSQALADLIQRQVQLQASTTAMQFNEKQLTAEQLTRKLTTLGLSESVTTLNAAQMSQAMQTAEIGRSQRVAIIQTLGLDSSTKALTATEVQNALAAQGITGANAEAILSALGLSIANKGLTASFVGLWTAIWPVLVIMLAIAGVVGIVKLFDELTVSAEEASEALSETKDNISALKSELESLQTELDKTKEKIADLEALPSLSLVQQEELDKLKEEVSLLERKKELQKRQIVAEEKQLIEDAEDVIKKKWTNSGEYNVVDGAITEDKWHTWGISGSDAINDAIKEYNRKADAIHNAYDVLTNLDDSQDFYSRGEHFTLSEQEILGLDGSGLVGNTTFTEQDLIDAIKKTEGENVAIATSIEDFFNDPDYSGLSYGMSDEIDAFLNEYNNAQAKWEKALYGENSKVNIIQSLFDTNATEEMQQLKNNIDEIVAGDDEWDVKNAAIMEHLNTIKETDEGYEQLKFAMNELDLAKQDIADYFTIQNGAFDSSTIDGIMAQYQTGIDAMKQFRDEEKFNYTDINGEIETIEWDDLFTQNLEGKLVAQTDKISKVLKNTDQQTRKEFTRLAEGVKNGEMDFEDAIKSFSLSGLIRQTALMEEQFSELNKITFKGLDDELSGFIDTFSELGSALEDVANSMDLVHQAEQQMNSSGQISLKTALELMNSTDRWNELLTIENGKIMLNANAEDILVQSKLNVIKANIDEALTSAQLQLAQLGTAESTIVSAEASDVTTEAYRVYTQAMNSYSASIAGFGAALGALIEGRFRDILGDFQDAYGAAQTVQTYEASVSTAELKEKIAQLQTQKQMLETVDTTSEFKNNYDFDTTPGDKYNDSDSTSGSDDKDDAFQDAMDYWENRLAANQARYDQIQNEIDLIETKGGIAGEEYYEEQVKLENQRLSLLNKQKAEAQKFLGTFTEGSEEWWEVAGQLNDIEGDIDDVTASIQDLQDAIDQIHWDIFDEAHERFGNLISQLSNVRDALSVDEDAFFDDEGNWTETGVAVLGTYIQEMEIYKNSLADVEKELKTLQKINPKNKKALDKAGFDSEQEYYDKIQELIEKQNEYTLAIKESEQSVVEMYESQIDAIEEYTNELIDSYSEYIELVQEALDAEKD